MKSIVDIVNDVSYKHAKSQCIICILGNAKITKPPKAAHEFASQRVRGPSNLRYTRRDDKKIFEN
jgi:hypothetical protein